MRTLLLVFILALPNLLVAQLSLTQEQTKMIGTTLQEISITDYIQNKPADTNFNNKFKVLEFWATWCIPCLKAVPHLNKLSKKFENENIVFLSFTYQKPDETIKTIERIKFETIVVSDQTKSIHQALKIENKGTMALPRTVLIDDENRIVWYGSPEKLTRKMIEKFLKKEKIID